MSDNIPAAADAGVPEPDHAAAAAAAAEAQAAVAPPPGAAEPAHDAPEPVPVAAAEAGPVLVDPPVNAQAALQASAPAPVTVSLPQLAIHTTRLEIIKNALKLGFPVEVAVAYAQEWDNWMMAEPSPAHRHARELLALEVTKTVDGLQLNGGHAEALADAAAFLVVTVG